ncbi:MAG: thiamine pyrophosphate-binding protein, partial [Geminicoccaceae bacterium]
TSGQKLGVFAMQHGPGAENAFGGVAQAYGEAVPILVLPQGYARRIAFVEPNFNSVLNMRGVTKSAEPILAGAEIPNIFRRAFTRLKSGRGGPVLVEVPADIYDEEVPEPLAYAPATLPRIGPDPEAVRTVAKRLAEAKRPVIYAGQGVHYARAWAELKQIAELLAAPVTTSLGGKSAFPENHMLSLGSGGNAIPAPVHHFLQNADLIFGIGCSFTKTNFGVDMPPGKAIIHATLDPIDVNKDVACEQALLGDAKLILSALLGELERLIASPRDPAPVADEIKAVREPWLAEWLPKLTSDETPLNPYRVLSELAHTVDLDNVIITHDAGSPRDQISPFWVSTTPLSYI